MFDVINDCWRWRDFLPSGGKFGFSVQKQIYESVNEDYGQFCSQVGWLTYNLHFRDRGFKFISWAAVGHLPSRIWAGGKKWWSHAEAMAKSWRSLIFNW